MSLLLPDQCYVCDYPGALLCAACVQTLEVHNVQQCMGCFAERQEGDFCEGCRAKDYESSLDFLFVSASYHGSPTLARLIQNMKYKPFTRIVDLLPDILFSRCGALYRQNKNVVIIPIPLHAKRLQERGYNQAELIGMRMQQLFPEWSINTKSVCRTRYTSPQAKLGRKERLTNVKGAFALLSNIPLAQEIQYLIVDDVSSTRSTMEEVASLLRSAGAKKVGGFVLARH